MKIRDLFESEYTEELTMNLEDLLFRVLANDKYKVPTQKVVNALRQMGMQVDPEDIVEIADELPVIDNASVTMIHLSGDITHKLAKDEAEEDEEQDLDIEGDEDETEEVTQQAEDEALKSIKQGP